MSTNETEVKVTKSEAAPVAEKPRQALSPFEEMERYMEEVFPRSWLRPMRWEWPDWSSLARFEMKTPKVDIIDRENEILVRADLPGVEKENLEVSMTDNTVTIKGETSKEVKEEKGDYYRRETMHGSFSRTVALPSDIDNTQAKASFKNGVLELTVPKVEKAKRRTVTVE